MMLIVKGSSSMLAQQETTKPLELPAFIIEGVEQHNIRSGIKQMPRKTPPLNNKELDSLNTYEKQLPTLLPVDKLPTHYISKPYTEGFIKASYGIFNSPEVVAGYRFFADRFDIFATAGGALSQGDAVNSENNKLFLDIRTNYIADERFFIFGGSNTHTNLFINTQNYNFYGFGVNPSNRNEKYPVKDYFDRNLTQAKFEVESEGNFENILFSIGGNANYIIANNNAEGNHLLNRDLENYYARGFLAIKNYWKNFLIGGDIKLNLESFDKKALNYYQIDASASYFNDNISILVKGGFQSAGSSTENTRNGLLLYGNIEYRINKLFTVQGSAFSGIEKTEFEDLIAVTPYLSSRLAIDHRYDIMNFKSSVWFHPNESFLLSAGLNWRFSDRNVIFTTDTLSEFKVVYIDGTVVEIFGETLWNITTKDKLIGKLSFNINDMPDGNYLTYLPAIKVSSTYHRTFWNKLRAFATLEFAGSRETDVNKKTSNTLDPYFMLNLGADITFSPINIFLKLNNVFNSKYVVWDKYYERGFFVALGVMWMF